MKWKVSPVAFIAILLAFGCYSSVQGFPNGAPVDSCSDMFPKHHTDQQSTVSPYSVLADKGAYSPDELIHVNLTGMEPFKGFIVKARRVMGDTEEAVGEFLDFDENSTVGQFWYPAKPGAMNCLTHVGDEEKTSLTFSWKSSESVGDLVFVATFVKDEYTFWVNVESEKITANEKPKGPKYSAEATILEHPSKDMRAMAKDCGFSKGCLLYPRFCEGISCAFMIVYQTLEDDKVSVEMFGRSEGYLSLGLSEDKYMGEDFTYTCFLKDGQASVQFGYNPSYYNDRHRATGISDVIVSRENGFMYCKFVMPTSMSLTHVIESHEDHHAVRNVTAFETRVKNLDLEQDFYLFLAAGDMYEGTSDVPKKHVQLPVVSKSKVKLLNSTDTQYGDGLSDFIKAHAILQLIAWFFLAILGMFITRHFRWELSKVCLGSAVWFQVHRLLMILVGILTIIGVILIFIYRARWTTKAVAHAVCGLVALGLSLLQLIAGFLRPHQKHSKRPVFVRLHRFGAFLTYVMAGVTLILAPMSDFLETDLSHQLMYIIVAGLLLYLLWEISLELMRYCICTYEDAESEKRHREKVKNVKILWFFTYFIVSLILLLLAVVFIALA